MTKPKNVRVLERLQSDLRAVFGASIPIDTLCSVLGFSSGETLQQALDRKLTLTLQSDPLSDDRYVRCDKVHELLGNLYSKAIQQDDEPRFKEVNMKK